MRETSPPVRPHDLRVTDARRSVTSCYRHVGVAEAGLRLRAAGLAGGRRPGHIYYETELRLRSAVQPEVRALTRQSNQSAPGTTSMRAPTLARMRQAPGDCFSLDAPPLQGWEPVGLETD